MLPVHKSETLQGREYIQVAPDVLLVRTAQEYSGAAVESDWEVVIGGVWVPNITVGTSSDGQYQLQVDNRFAFWLGAQTPDALEQILLALANAMAVAAGFSCFGARSEVINPYKKWPMPHGVSNVVTATWSVSAATTAREPIASDAEPPITRREMRDAITDAVARAAWGFIE